MDFSHALQNARKGRKISRSGWNGKGMYVVMQKGYPDGIPINQNTADAMGLPLGTVCKFQPYLMLVKEQSAGTFVCTSGWVPSQEDLLSNDWILV
jgi:Protein of unknown function (DUF2829)